MLIGEDFLKAEEKYRRERIGRDARQGGWYMRAVGALVVASMLLVACGAPADSTPDEAQSVARPVVVQDHAPAWQPSQTLLASILEGEEQDAPAEIGGTRAPSWDPNYAALQSYMTAEQAPKTGPR